MGCEELGKLMLCDHVFFFAPIFLTFRFSAGSLLPLSFPRNTFGTKRKTTLTFKMLHSVLSISLLFCLGIPANSVERVRKLPNTRYRPVHTAHKIWCGLFFIQRIWNPDKITHTVSNWIWNEMLRSQFRSISLNTICMDFSFGWSCQFSPDPTSEIIKSDRIINIKSTLKL